MNSDDVLIKRDDAILSVAQIENILFTDLMYKHHNDRYLVTLIFEYKYATYFNRIYRFLGRDE